MSPFLPLLGPREMSDLSPQSGPKRTLIRSPLSIARFYEYTPWLESPPSITRSTGRAFVGGDTNGCVSSSSTAIAFLNSSSRTVGLMVAAAIRSHRSLAAVSAARLASSLDEDSSNSCRSVSPHIWRKCHGDRVRRAGQPQRRFDASWLSRRTWGT